VTSKNELPRGIAPPEADAFLEAQYPRSLHLLGMIRGGEARLVECVADGVLVRGKVSYGLLATSAEATESLLDRISWDGPVSFSALPSTIADHVVRRGTVSWRDQFWLCYLPGDARLPSPPASVQPLDPRDASTIQRFWPYADESSILYIRERIEGGITAGLRLGGDLVSWGLTHTSGAMGFLHVLEDHRGRGYAKAVTYRLVEEIRRRGETPFVYISVRNDSSLGLAAKLGMVRVEQVEWLALNEG
jgi:ribosomal protein S18 acetylase RimI-like enzyme